MLAIAAASDGAARLAGPITCCAANSAANRQASHLERCSVFASGVVSEDNVFTVPYRGYLYPDGLYMYISTLRVSTGVHNIASAIMPNKATP